MYVYVFTFMFRYGNCKYYFSAETKKNFKNSSNFDQTSNRRQIPSGLLLWWVTHNLWLIILISLFEVFCKTKVLPASDVTSLKEKIIALGGHVIPNIKTFDIKSLKTGEEIFSISNEEQRTMTYMVCILYQFTVCKIKWITGIQLHTITCYILYINTYNLYRIIYKL